MELVHSFKTVSFSKLAIFGPSPLHLFVYKKFTTENTFDFDGNNPSYFKISSVNGDLDISNVVINYSCIECEEPVASTDVLYTYDSTTNSYKIGKKYSASADREKVVSVYIPNHYNDGEHGDHPVTVIDNDAFNTYKNLEKVFIPSTITSIGSQAFYQCFSLANIDIPNSVTSIGGSAFKYCIKLTKLYIPNSVITVNSHIVTGCSDLVSINCPKGVAELPSYFLYNCAAIEEFTISSNVTKINNNAFASLTKLAHLYYDGTSSDWDNVNKKYTVSYKWIDNCNGITTPEFLK